MRNPHQLPSLAGLEAFDAVVRLGSFAAAARSLGVTESAISHRIRGLEQSLSCTLFIRRARRVEPSAEGRVLAETTLQAFALLREGLARLESSQREDRLTVSCSPSFALRWLVPALPDFNARHPEIEVLLSASDRLVEPGTTGIDACLRYGAGPYVGVDQTRLTDERVGPVCSPSLVAKLERPEDLLGVTLLHDEVLREHPGRVGWRRWLEAAGVTAKPPRGPRFSHAHMALEAAVAGQGVALGRGTLVARDLAAGRLVRPFELELPTALAYWLLTPQGGARRAVEPFRVWLLETIAASARAGGA